MNDTPQEHREQNATVSTQEGILVMVMGEASNYQKWTRLWRSFLTREETNSATFAQEEEQGDIFPNNKHSQSPSFLVYASYDAPVNVSLSSCTNGDNGILDSKRCNRNTNTIFIPGTTWTQGRNKLIIEALRLESMYGKKYDYWLFLDDDVVFRRKKQYIGWNKSKTMGANKHVYWNKFMDVLKDRTLVPQKATTVSIVGGGIYDVLTNRHNATSNTDAMIAAFKREYVPYLLPYAYLSEGESQWTSQAVLFCVMWSCFKQSTYLIPDISPRNPLHRPYTRGWNISSFQKATADNYESYMPLHHMCNEEQQFHQLSDVISASSVEELDAMIPSMNSSCDVLKRRFFDWVAQETRSN